MKDKGGYWYKNRTLIEGLDITTLDDQKNMETIISEEEKYRRKNIKRTPRNEEGLTNRQHAKLDKSKAVHSLKNKRYTLKEIAVRLTISYDTVKYYLYI